MKRTHIVSKKNNMTEDELNKKLEELPYIIAVDFDGTLVEDDYPRIGNIKSDTWEMARSAQEKGAKLILWTCRTGSKLDEAVWFCSDNGLKFDAVNQDIPAVRRLLGKGIKVFADEYWDDKANVFFSTLEY